MDNGVSVVLLVLSVVLATSSYPYHHLPQNMRNRRVPNPRRMYKSQEMLIRGRRGEAPESREVSYLSHNPFQPNPAQQPYGFANPPQPVHSAQQQMQPMGAHLQPIPPIGVQPPPSQPIGSNQPGVLPLDTDPNTEQRFQSGYQPNNFPTARRDLPNMEAGHSDTASGHQSAPKPAPQAEDSMANDPNVPCDKSKCVEPANCINVTQGESDCCPRCAQRGCQCEGYQYYDCLLNGYEKGRVPEGKSYSVDSGSTMCSCPMGGGIISCSYQDTFSDPAGYIPPSQPKLICPESPHACIETYTRPDGCAECITIGCVEEDGTKHIAGSSFDKPPCSVCYCPNEGGTAYCSLDQACLERSSTQGQDVADPPQTSQALEATQRVMRDPLRPESQLNGQSSSYDSSQYGKGVKLGSDDGTELGYDTRYLQPDWNQQFGSSSNSYQSPDSDDSDASSSKDAGDVVVPPLVSPDAASTDTGSQDTQNPQSNGYGTYQSQNGYMNPGSQLIGSNGFGGYGYGGYNQYPYQQQPYAQYPYGYQGYGAQGHSDIPSARNSPPEDENAKQDAAVPSPEGDSQAPNSQTNFNRQPGGYSYESQYPQYFGNHNPRNQMTGGSETGAAVGVEDAHAGDGYNVGQNGQASAQDQDVGGNTDMSLGSAHQNAGNQGVGSETGAVDEGNPLTSDKTKPESNEIPKGGFGGYQNPYPNYYRPGYGQNYMGQSSPDKTSQSLGPVGQDQYQSANQYQYNYGQVAPDPPARQTERSANPEARTGESYGAFGSVSGQRSESNQEQPSQLGYGLAGATGGAEATDNHEKASVTSDREVPVDSSSSEHALLSKNQGTGSVESPAGGEVSDSSGSKLGQAQEQLPIQEHGQLQPGSYQNYQNQYPGYYGYGQKQNGVGNSVDRPASDLEPNQPSSGVNSNSMYNNQFTGPNPANKNSMGYGTAYYNYLQSMRYPYQNQNIGQGYNYQYPLQPESYPNPAGYNPQQGTADSPQQQGSNTLLNGYGQQSDQTGSEQALLLNGHHSPANDTASESDYQRPSTARAVAPTSGVPSAIPTTQFVGQLNTATEASSNGTSFENVLSACCVQGKQWAVNHDSCSGIRVTVDTYSQICAVAQEKCCMEVKNQETCQIGIRTARSMAACDVPRHLDGQCDRDGFKACCDCCALGLKAFGLSLSCDMKILGEPCGSAYSECCRKGRLMLTDRQLPVVPETARTPTQQNEAGVGSESFNHPRCATHNNCADICRDTATGVECLCRPGYSLEDDGRSCADINECIIGTHTCSEGQFCLNNIGSYNCQRSISCGTGYELTESNSCNDIDECALNLHNCGESLDCVNIRGSFRCIAKSCDAGYITDATGGCIDIDECRSGDYACPPRSRCENTVGSYSCRCPDGLAFDKSRQTCQDIDECDLGVSNCQEGSTCVNTDGSFTCIDPPTLTCTAGYVVNQAKTECVDVDECVEGSHSCSQGSTCINEDGGFRCQDPIQCEPGTRPSASQRSCVDIDECAESDTDRCGEGGTCVNLQGSYRCECKRGYRKGNATNGVETCKDVDECREAAGRQCAHQCENSPGSYACVCPSGYTVNIYERSCQDVDECALHLDNCSASETCFNTRGGFKCVTLECPANYAKLSSRRKALVKCWDRNICRSGRCPVKTYTYLHVSLPSIPALRNAELLMKLHKGKSDANFNVAITSGNEEEKFLLSNFDALAKLFLARSITGPWETKLHIEATETTSKSQQRKVVVVYIYVSEYAY